ncbi:MAG: pentapeptide repeat-containing protein [Lentisphaeraceae bacterium]|nr:pentapeptide repeat-containing protein [Lentisphaeraceae bacterium]
MDLYQNALKPIIFHDCIFDGVTTGVFINSFSSLKVTFSKCQIKISDYSNNFKLGFEFQNCTFLGKCCDRNFEGAKFRNCNFSWINCDRSNFADAQFYGCNLENTSLIDIKINDKTAFHDLKSIIDCKMTHYTVEQMQDNEGKIPRYHLTTMNIQNPLATIKGEFSGYKRLTHLLSLAIFLLPYVVFLARCHFELIVNRGPHTGDTIFWRFVQYVRTGGEMVGETKGPLVFVFFITLFYNALRVLFIYKTNLEEEYEKNTGFPSKFSLTKSTVLGMKWSVALLIMKIWYWINIGVVAVHTVYFLSTRLPVA